jgi:hypothetical protein
MKVPVNVRVSPTTAQLLDSLKDRREAKELAMHAADLSQKYIRLLELFGQSCREYAASEDCRVTHALKEAGKPLSSMGVLLCSMAVELTALHAIHHQHGDAAHYSETLDAIVPGITQMIASTQGIRQQAKEELLPSEMSFEDVLKAFFG